jgi:hypothetical protein
MSIVIPQVDIKKVYEKVKNIDVYELMLLSIQDHADWLVTEYTKMCMESTKDPQEFKECLYEVKGEVEKSLYMYIHDIYENTIMLFGIFYNYQLPENHEFNRKIEEIVQETLRRLSPST